MSRDRSHDVFLSYNSADKLAVEEIARRLAQEGIRPWLDRWHLVPGEPWQEAIEEALRQSETVAVFIGPSGISPWHNEELRVALDEAARTRDDYRTIPVLIPGAAIESVSGFLARRTWVDFRPGLDDADAFARLVAGIRGEPPEQADAFALPDEPAPYPGLLPFTEDQADFFFGRTEDRTRLLARVSASSFVAVVGASGSGKSSLVQAGLLPALDQGQHALTLVPGTRPLRALADQLATLVPPADRLHLADEIEMRLMDRADGLSTALSTLLADHSDIAALLLVVDQFEELFTQVPGTPEERRRQQQRFIANLVDAVNAAGGRVRVVLTLRADFVRHCLDFADLRALLEANQLLLGPMSQDDLREAIVRPAQKVGAFLEKGLVGRLLDDMRDQPAALPLLSFALAQLWQQRHGVWLTHAAYEAIGGVSGAVDRRADAVYERLSEKQRFLARNLFVRLVALGEGTNDTRRRVHCEELYLVGATSAEVDGLIGILSHRDVRLISADAETVELAHEALIRSWSRLQGWIDESRADLRLHRRLTEAANEWVGHDRDESYLYRGGRLTAVEKAIPVNAFSTLENEFFRASVDVRRAERRAHRWRLTLVVAMVGLVLLLLTSTGGILWLWRQYTLSSTPSWQPVAGFPDDPVMALVATNESPPTYYVGTRDVGVGRSRDGVTWTLHRQGLPTGTAAGGVASKNVKAVMRVAVDGSDPRRLFAFVSASGLYRSQDRGETWQMMSDDSLPRGPDEGVYALDAHGDLVLVVVTAPLSAEGGLYASQDGGVHWQLIGGWNQAPLGQVYAAYITPDGATIYAGTSSGLYSSPTSPPWKWERVLELAPVGIVTPEAGGGDGLYLMVPTDQGLGEIWHWRPGEQALRLSAMEPAPDVLTPHPNPAAPIAMYALVFPGKVLAVTDDGQNVALDQHPGQANDLLAVSHPADGSTWLLLGHADGLLEYRGSPDQEP